MRCPLALLCARIILAISTALAALALVGSMARGAPAPLPRHERRTVREIPTITVMTWMAIKYDTTFFPDGRYEASDVASPSIRWLGRWYRVGSILVIQERIASQPEGSEMTYRIEMDETLRRGRINGCETVNFFLTN